MTEPDEKLNGIAMAKIAHLALRRQLIDVCRRMNTLGINQGTSGNASIRVRGGLLITPSGLPYDAMKPEHIVRLDYGGAYRGAIAPSSEWRIHADLYRAREDARAILHTHANFCTALACLGRAIPAFHYMVAVAGGHDIRCAPYATFGTQALSDHALKALKNRKACLLANHGMVCLEADIERCLGLAVEVETLARQYWHALQIGEPTILTRAEMARVINRFASYGNQSVPRA